MSKGFLTIAYGSPEYIRMGKGLARSIRAHNPSARLALVTDSEDDKLHALFDIVISLDPRLGSGVSQKLFLDYYTPFEQTIFIDSDCLAYRDPEELWPMYQIAAGFAIKGWGYLRSGETHYAVDDLEKYLASFHVKRIAALNSGVIYFDRSQLASRVFDCARMIANQRAAVGLIPFKNSPVNDEPVFAMAMELNSIEILPWDNGRAMSTVSGKLRGTESIDAFEGKGKYEKNGTVVDPVLIHYHVQCQSYFFYRRQLMRLALIPRLYSRRISALFTMPEMVPIIARYYARRANQRVGEVGLWGLVPERLSNRFLDRRMR